MVEEDHQAEVAPLPWQCLDNKPFNPFAERVKAMGVTAFYKRFTHDGVTGPNMAAVYSDRGCGSAHYCGRSYFTQYDYNNLSSE